LYYLSLLVGQPFSELALPIQLHLPMVEPLHLVAAPSKPRLPMVEPLLQEPKLPQEQKKRQQHHLATNLIKDNPLKTYTL
jgi:hypothetical protein